MWSDTANSGGRRDEIVRKTPDKSYVISRSYETPPRQRAVRPNAKPWWNNAESKRKKRVARYKFYTVEGKVKLSIKKGFRWFKKTCSRIVHGL